MEVPSNELKIEVLKTEHQHRKNANCIRINPEWFHRVTAESVASGIVTLSKNGEVKFMGILLSEDVNVEKWEIVV